MTDEEARDLNVRVEVSLGDDLTCFAPDGTERYDRIERALLIWWGDERWFCHHDIIRGLSGKYRDSWFQGKDSAWQVAWNERHGQPWQVDIEAYIAAWMAEPRNFCGDDALALTLVDKIRDMGYPVYIRFAPTGTADDGLNDHRWSGFAQSYTRAEIVVEVGYGVKSPLEFFRQGWGETIALAVTRAYLAVAETGAKGESNADTAS